MKILLATHNPAKINDYQTILSAKKIELETLKTLGLNQEFIESKGSFAENAREKALFYFKLAKIPALAEDGGLEIDFLNGQPGVKSRRWPGYEATDEELVAYLKEKIKEIPSRQRTARFTATCCLVKTETKIYLVKNSMEGYLTDEYNNNYPKGFPYRAFFIEKTFNKYIMDLTPPEYHQINHRRKNIEEIVKYLNDK